MSAGAQEALRFQHEATASFEQQSQVHNHYEQIQPDFDVEHGNEGHVCNANCEHSQSQADMLSDDLFAEGAHEHVCGPDCEHSSHAANEIADTLFEDLEQPDLQKVKSHITESKVITDQEKANDQAKDLQHDHEGEPHVCHANCEHNQGKANKHADSLFEELDSNANKQSDNIANTVKNLLEEVAISDAQAAALHALQLEQQHLTDAELSVRPEEHDTSVIESVAGKDMAESVKELYVQNEAKRQAEDAAITPRPETETELVSSLGEEPLDIEEASSYELQEIVPNAQVIAGQGFMDAVATPEDYLVDDAETPVVIGPVDTSDLFVYDLPEPEAVSLNIVEIENSDADLASYVLEFDHRENSTPQGLGIEHGMHQDVISALHESIDSANYEQVQQLIGQILEVAEGSLSSIEGFMMYTPELRVKLSELADLLSMDFEELIEVMDITIDNESLTFDQQAYDILLGLKKDISMEYSLEFTQTGSTQNASAKPIITRVLGQLILLILASNRAKQPHALAA